MGRLTAGRLVVLGSANLDLYLRVPELPRPGETVVGSDVERRFGGKGANQAIAAARAGAPTLFLGRVGDDEAGRAYLERLRAFGVHLGRKTSDPTAPTGTAVICVDAHGENMIVVSPGANAAVTVAVLDDLPELGPGDVLLAQLEVDPAVVAAAARRAAAAGSRVVLNASPTAPLPHDVLALADPVVVNEHEVAALPDGGRALPSVLVTRGASGSTWGAETVPAESADVVDTTGAGDAYCGTLAARLAQGDQRRDAMRAAASAAAECVRRLGAQPSLDVATL